MDAVEDGVVWGVDGHGRTDVHSLTGYALDWSDGATLGAVEHDVLGPAGWHVDRRLSMWGTWRSGRRVTTPWRASLAEALRDALEVIGG